MFNIKHFHLPETMMQSHFFHRTMIAGVAISYLHCSDARTTVAQNADVQNTQKASVATSGADSIPTSPPKEEGNFRASDLVELVKLDNSIKLDVRYAKKNNFVGRPLYKEERAFLQRPAAEALVRAHKELQKQGYGLLIFDGYRPWRITRLFWEVTPAALKKFVANPAKGSRHNRGCAVDLSLYDMKTGKEIPMPSEYDEMTDRAYPGYTGGTPEQTRLRDLLKEKMEEQGFKVFSIEWWHFDYKDWREYPILDIDFSQVK